MHHKFLILLDKKKRQWVLNGSFNYSHHSSQNIENIMALSNKSVVEAFQQEFDSVWNASRAVRLRKV